jgi:hypothetical protein
VTLTYRASVRVYSTITVVTHAVVAHEYPTLRHHTQLAHIVVAVVTHVAVAAPRC